MQMQVAAGSVLAPTGSRTAQAAGVAMAPHPTTILGLAPCLGQMIHMQNGPLPPPSLRAEPGPEVPWGWPVTILCRSPAGAHTFRLEQKENRSAYMDQKITSQYGSPGTEARFPIRAVSDVTAGPYRCAYRKGSERSEALELVLTGVTTGGISTPLTHTATPSSAGSVKAVIPTTANVGHPRLTPKSPSFSGCAETKFKTGIGCCSSQ
ncbi:leukocyte-associated immunoglobulin-like receptor 2 isoform X2 [Rhinolophus sinicus]|uniref:leukocyte-associated immunoglobulin-like receptor 2 isoform X2 n=1 Tax=Rhinolophus sinicus TaxID=89399 RepID=UPI003D78F79E